MGRGGVLRTYQLLHVLDSLWSLWHIISILQADIRNAVYEVLGGELREEFFDAFWGSGKLG